MLTLRLLGEMAAVKLAYIGYAFMKMYLNCGHLARPTQHRNNIRICLMGKHRHLPLSFSMKTLIDNHGNLISEYCQESKVKCFKRHISCRVAW